MAVRKARKEKAKIMTTLALATYGGRAFLDDRELRYSSRRRFTDAVWDDEKDKDASIWMMAVQILIVWSAFESD